MYSDLVMEHFANPRNVGEVDDPDGVGEIGNPAKSAAPALVISSMEEASNIKNFMELFHST